MLGTPQSINFFKNLSEDRIRELSNLPQEYSLGQANDNGDCFFHAVAQHLNLFFPEEHYSVESVRRLCASYYFDNSNNAQWIDEAHQMDYAQGGIPMAYEHVIRSADNYDDAVLWGRLGIEGRILCYVLDERHPEFHFTMSSYSISGASEETAIIHHQVVNQGGGTDTAVPHEPQADHIVLILSNVDDERHFIPALSREELSHNMKPESESEPEVETELQQTAKIKLNPSLSNDGIDIELTPAPRIKKLIPSASQRWLPAVEPPEFIPTRENRYRSVFEVPPESDLPESKPPRKISKKMELKLQDRVIAHKIRKKLSGKPLRQQLIDVVIRQNLSTTFADAEMFLEMKLNEDYQGGAFFGKLPSDFEAHKSTGSKVVDLDERISQLRDQNQAENNEFIQWMNENPIDMVHKSNKKPNGEVKVKNISEEKPEKIQAQRNNKIEERKARDKKIEELIAECEERKLVAEFTRVVSQGNYYPFIFTKLSQIKKLNRILRNLKITSADFKKLKSDYLKSLGHEANPNMDEVAFKRDPKARQIQEKLDLIIQQLKNTKEQILADIESALNAAYGHNGPRKVYRVENAGGENLPGIIVKKGRKPFVFIRPGIVPLTRNEDNQIVVDPCCYIAAWEREQNAKAEFYLDLNNLLKSYPGLCSDLYAFVGIYFNAKEHSDLYVDGQGILGYEFISEFEERDRLMGVEISRYLPGQSLNKYFESLRTNNFLNAEDIKKTGKIELFREIRIEPRIEFTDDDQYEFFAQKLDDLMHLYLICGYMKDFCEKFAHLVKLNIMFPDVKPQNLVICQGRVYSGDLKSLIFKKKLLKADFKALLSTYGMVTEGYIYLPESVWNLASQAILTTTYEMLIHKPTPRIQFRGFDFARAMDELSEKFDWLPGVSDLFNSILDVAPELALEDASRSKFDFKLFGTKRKGSRSNTRTKHKDKTEKKGKLLEENLFIPKSEDEKNEVNDYGQLTDLVNIFSEIRALIENCAGREILAGFIFPESNNNSNTT